MARLILSPGDTNTTELTSENVFGYNESTEFVTVKANGKVTFDGSFGQGGDTIFINGAAGLYKIATDGGNVVITSTTGAANGARIVIPYGTVGATIKFADSQFNLSSTATGDVSLGNTAVGDSAVQIPGVITPPVGGDTIRFTVGNDIDLQGTSGNDIFRASVQQNQLGQQANSLGTGDEAHGGAGIDTLDAQLTEGVQLSGANGAVAPVLDGIENLDFRATSNQQGSSYLRWGTTEIYVDAKDIVDHVHIASNLSDGNLTIQDLTTLDDNGAKRAVSSLTVAMEYTGNADSRWEESDFTVLFDQDYLTTTDVVTKAARVELQAMNEDNYDKSNGTQPLSGVYFSQLKFNLNGVSYDLAPFLPTDKDNRPAANPTVSGREINTYNDLLSAVQSAVAALKAANPGNAALQTLQATIGSTFTTDISPVTNQLRQGTSIDLTVATSTNGAANQLSAAQTDLVLIPTPGLDPNDLPNSNRYERANFVPPQFQSQLSINIDLEKVGRAGDGGELVVGSMNKHDLTPSDIANTGLIPGSTSSFPVGSAIPLLLSQAGISDPNALIQSLIGELGRGTFYKSYPNEWNAQYSVAKSAVLGASGIPTFNVTVYGGADKPSSLSGLHSTNDVLREVNITTDAAQTGSFADLAIGNANTIGGHLGALKNVATFNSTTFKGDVALTAGLDDSMDEKYGNGPIQVRYDFGAGNDTLNFAVGANEHQGLNISVNMNAGDDTARIMLDGDAVDAVTERFDLTLGEGNNTAYVFTVDDIRSEDPFIRDSLTSAGTDYSNGLTVAESDILRNLTITSGSGVDRVEVGGSGNFNIKVGANSDFVIVSSSTPQGSLNEAVSQSLDLQANNFDAPVVSDRPFGSWDPLLADPSGSTGSTDQLPLLNRGIPLYGAKLQVRFAGFESTVDLTSLAANKYIVTEQDVNKAIIAAIAANPELQRLITAEIGSVKQDISIYSLISGDNQIELTIFQPELRTQASVTALAPLLTTQVILPDTAAPILAQGLVATGLAFNSQDIGNSDGVANAAGVEPSADETVLFFNSKTPIGGTGGAGPGQSGGLDSTDLAIVDNGPAVNSGQSTSTLHGFYFYEHSTIPGTSGTHYGSQVNDSVIDMGKGANDLVVLSDNPNSHNTLVFSAAWDGKTSVVNFFSNTASLYAGDTPGNEAGFDGVASLHQLNFSAFLNSKMSSSGSLLSIEDKQIGVLDATAVPTSQVYTLQANSIVVTNIDTLESASGYQTGSTTVLKDLSFNNLSSTDVLAALNAHPGTVTTTPASAGTATPGAGVDFVSATEHTGGAGELVDSGSTPVTTRFSLLFVENIDTPYQDVATGLTHTPPLNYANHGDYKVFLVSYDDGSTVEGTKTAGDHVLQGSTLNFLSAQYLGEIDFGNSLDLRPVATAITAPGGTATAFSDVPSTDVNYYNNSAATAGVAAHYDPTLYFTTQIVNGAYSAAVI